MNASGAVNGSSRTGFIRPSSPAVATSGEGHRSKSCPKRKSPTRRRGSELRGIQTYSQQPLCVSVQCGPLWRTRGRHRGVHVLRQAPFVGFLSKLATLSGQQPAPVSRQGPRLPPPASSNDVQLRMNYRRPLMAFIRRMVSFARCVEIVCKVLVCPARLGFGDAQTRAPG
jgi:hypothetical protein